MLLYINCLIYNKKKLYLNGLMSLKLTYTTSIEQVTFFLIFLKEEWIIRNDVIIWFIQTCLEVKTCNNQGWIHIFQIIYRKWISRFAYQQSFIVDDFISITKNSKCISFEYKFVNINLKCISYGLKIRWWQNFKFPLWNGEVISLLAKNADSSIQLRFFI